MKNKLIIIPSLMFAVASCTSFSTAPTIKSQVASEAYTVEHGVLVELQVKSMTREAMEGYFLRAIALRGHDMSAMTATSHDHDDAQKDQAVNLLDELVKQGCTFKTELYTHNQRLLVKKDTALFVCHEKNYVIAGELVDTHGAQGGALSLTKGSHVYFKIK
jgi:hypothetical protein